MTRSNMLGCALIAAAGLSLGACAQLGAVANDIQQYDTPAVAADLSTINADAVQTARDTGNLAALASDATKTQTDLAQLRADVAAAKAAGAPVSPTAVKAVTSVPAAAPSPAH